MGYFPLCIDLAGKTVFLVGDGAQIRDKAEKLASFSPNMVFLNDLSADDLDARPALVIVGDVEYECAERISRLCRERNVPVNVVDIPQLCSFFFPSLIVSGDLTVSVSTGGKSPAAAAYLKGEIAANIPDRTDEILLWFAANRAKLREQGILKAAVARAFKHDRPLSWEECENLSKKQ